MEAAQKFSAYNKKTAINIIKLIKTIPITLNAFFIVFSFRFGP